MSEMIERVTRAICMPFHDHVAEPEACCGECGIVTEKAIAAIKAMRGPTAAMRTAGAEAERPYGSIQAAYEAMIDEALK